MSLAGLNQFKENLDTLMKSEIFKKADDGKKWDLGYRFLNSKYGLTFCGKVKKLER